MHGRATSAPGPKILVTFASRHGGTREIAAAIARGLIGGEAGRRAGVTAALVPVELRPDPTAFDAVVLGSAVYDGRWLEPAVRYAWETAATLSTGRTWLFSSGLREDPSGQPPEIDDARALAGAIGAREHRLFTGRVERRLLTAVEREIWADGSTVTGDFRDWAAVRGWAEQIASATASSSAVAAVG